MPLSHALTSTQYSVVLLSIITDVEVDQHCRGDSSETGRLIP